MDAQATAHPGQLPSAPQDPAAAHQSRIALALAEFEGAEGAEPHELAAVFDGVYQHLRAALDAAERV
ncbi:MAG: hypothetical protein ACH36H_07605 [Candidatus Nanopelagicales bacterium]